MTSTANKGGLRAAAGARRTKAAQRTPLPPRPGFGPVEVRRANPVAWRVALRLVVGDASRLVVEADGSVIIRNK